MRVRISGLEEFCEYLAHYGERFINITRGKCVLSWGYQYLRIEFKPWLCAPDCEAEVILYDTEQKKIVHHSGRHYL